MTKVFGRFTTCVAVLVISVSQVLAIGGTSIVASKGHLTNVPSSWPEGAGELVNDPLRTTGWNSWFSEWPNDVNQYGRNNRDIL